MPLLFIFINYSLEINTMKIINKRKEKYWIIFVVEWSDKSTLSILVSRMDYERFKNHCIWAIRKVQIKGKDIFNYSQILSEEEYLRQYRNHCSRQGDNQFEICYHTDSNFLKETLCNPELSIFFNALQAS